MPAQALTIVSPPMGLDVSLSGVDLSWLWTLPFAGLLLSIAVLPVLAQRFWHGNFGKVALFWSVVFLVPFFAHFGFDLASAELMHVMVLDYLPFIILLTTLYVVAGGIHVSSGFHATPAFNTGLLAFGTLIASWIGTTGASMLLIRPLIAANRYRHSVAHVMMFFIFLVANVGGALTPLGDPPLFLGYLNGVEFFWTTRFLFAPMMFIAAVLLTMFWFLDRWLFLREGFRIEPHARRPRLVLVGNFNIVLLVAVIAAILISGSEGADIGEVDIGPIHLPLANILRDLSLLAILIVSWKATRPSLRRANHFSWFPMEEVAKLFAGIFITIIPALALLRAGALDMEGLFPFLSLETSYFWSTGLLSSVLDNAPTYLVFFNAAGGDAEYLMNEGASLLMAISAGAVFMGALTYIGNAPNFMVRAIAQERGIKMPSFFAYVGWASLALMPVFVLVTLLWFV